MSRKYQTYSPEFKASAIDLANRVTIPVAAAQLGCNDQSIRNWIAAAGAAKPKASTRAFWTDQDTDALASEWISLRMADPLESATVLAEKAQRKVFAGRGHLQRDISSVKNIAPLCRSIAKLWKELLDKPAEAPAPVEPPPPPLPTVVEVEVPRKWTFQEMLDGIDEPALEALLSAKRLSRENTFHQLLQTLALHNGATAPTVKPFVPKMEIYEAASKRTPRIAVLGLPESRNQSLAAEITKGEYDCTLSFPEPKDRTTVMRCDFAIVCREPDKLNSSVSDRIIGDLGRNRVTLVDASDAPAVLQAVRNILSRK